MSAEPENAQRSTPNAERPSAVVAPELVLKLARELYTVGLRAHNEHRVSTGMTATRTKGWADMDPDLRPAWIAVAAYVLTQINLGVADTQAASAASAPSCENKGGES